MMSQFPHAAIGADEPVRSSDSALDAGPRARDPHTPAAILWREHGRRPLNCDEGEIRNDLGAAQTAAAERHWCPVCGRQLKDDWHGVAACFCNLGGQAPVIPPA